ncbi:glycogen debranching protein GlgX [Arthrobacter sp. JZ12]|uniref:glycogen debranching protein GlgX n=1 Tax=Arthrobacter sp. JZ12 TaxID=2654190 RepID=UPI002B468AC6|nr:glycogen debranching protein GlgX [Arthrobacter sp. JZ12]WRH24025.1 glycogen debranching protein GlgX [Arthrobacter sp. JZ12]
MTLSTGLPQLSQAFPLGVRPLEGGAEGQYNVAVYAPDLDAVALHYQDRRRKWRSIVLPELTDGVHHGLVDGLAESAKYGFWPAEVAAPGKPGTAQLLLDPYGRSISTVHVEGNPVYFSVLVAADFDWGSSRRPSTRWRDTVIYETHVKGLTQLHPDVPEELRGTYAGLAHPAMIGHFTDLGITAVELLPIHFHIDEPHLGPLGLTNYWGYNTLGFFAPHPEYATAAARKAGPKAVQDEVKNTVKALHEAGIEVLLDVVYNHTAEGPQGGPALCWRGLSEMKYYRHHDDGRYLDTTGCGNTVNFAEPRVIQFALDSLRYWVDEFGIDGFRFDLAVALCRDENHQFTPRHPLLVAIGADTVLRGVKLIAEPWDVGHNGWQTGNFPQGWADWNDRFRDTARDFWLADQAALADGRRAGTIARLASSLAGSAEVFARSGRSAISSINYVTSHDGFTLADLTAYNRKHNEANGEANRDGHNDNRSYNHGVEGPTEKESILAARSQTARNLMATQLLALGVPMITAGDEFGRTQLGNNNAYCQDNELAWVHWNHDDAATTMLDTTRALLRIRREFLTEQPPGYPAREELSYLLWFNADGEPMSRDQWSNPDCRLVQLLLGSPEGGLNGLVVINGHLENRPITLPRPEALRQFDVLAGPDQTFDLRFTTAEDNAERRGTRLRAGEADTAASNSVTVYRA